MIVSKSSPCMIFLIITGTKPQQNNIVPLVLHKWVNRVSIGSDNGLSPIRRQAII